MKTVILAASLLAVSSAPCCAGEVFNSGTLPDFTNSANFFISDETPPIAPPGWINHVFISGTPPAPVMVRSIEFYGYTEGILSVPADHGFTIIVDGIRTPLAIQREVVAPAFNATSTPVYRYRVDVAPFTFSGSQVLIRGVTGATEAWNWAVNASAQEGIARRFYGDKDLTSFLYAVLGSSNTFILHDSYQVISEPSLEITSFKSLGGSLFEVTLKGANESAYEIRSSPALDFSAGALVENLSKGDPGDPGTIGGTNNRVVTTDGSGDAKVRMTLTGSVVYIRAECTD